MSYLNISKEEIEEALRETRGHRQAAADILGVTRQTLWAWIKDNNIDVKVFREIPEADRTQVFPKDKKGEGYIYLIKESWRGMYKIGVAKNIKKRIGQMRTNTPQKLHLVAWILAKEPYKLEYQLHTMFSEKRYRNEWFELDNDDVRFIVDNYNGYIQPSQLKLFKQKEVKNEQI